MLASSSFVRMATGLAVLGIVRALSIDNQLTPLVSDCFERLTIGERLNPDKVSKSFKHNTVADCKRACSEQKNSCRAFAFGISAKGNATCELSVDAIKETADLKPIGTVSDTDFDLYIKKLDCTLVIDKSPHVKPSDQDFRPSLKPITLGNIPAEDEIFFKPLQDAIDGPAPPDGPSRPPDLSNLYLPSKNPHRPPHPPDSGHYYDSDVDRISYGDRRPTQPPRSPNKDGVQNVQTLVSVASGPQTVLNPVHGILVAGDSQLGYGGQHDEKRPSFIPESSNSPHEDHKVLQRPNDFDRPDQHGGIRPVFEINDDYGQSTFFQRPYGPVERPDLHRYDVSKPGSTEYYSDRYGDRPSRIPFRPQSNYYNYQFPDKYGSLIPHPDSYNNNKPLAQSEYLFQHQQQHEEYHNEYFHHSIKNDYQYHKPYRPLESYDDFRRPSGEKYSYNHRPGSPQYAPQDDRPSWKPDGISSYGPYQNERPSKPNGSYDDERPSSKPSTGYGSERPENNGPYEGTRPNRPSNDRPYQNSRPNDSDRPYDDTRPYRPYQNSRPIDSDRPYEDSRPNVQPYDDSRPDADRPHHIRPYEDSKPVKGKPYEGFGPYGDVSKPNNDGPHGDQSYEYPRPQGDSNIRPHDDERPNRPRPVGNGLSSYGESDRGPSRGGTKKPIVTNSIGYHGEQITSIITELDDACFRRVLAGKRVSQIFVKRALTCETVEECQRECADEKRFSCEGFNYRLDPSGRGKGDCELINQPLSRLDIGRDLYPERDYDYYERDRNAAPLNCNRIPSGYGYGGYGGYTGGESHYGSYDHRYRGGGGYYADRRFDYEVTGHRRPANDYGPSVLRRPGDRWSDDDRYDRRRPSYDYDRRKPHFPYDRDYPSSGNRRGDFTHPHEPQPHFYENDRRYHGTRPLKPDPHEPYLPPRYHENQKYWDSSRYGGSFRPPEGNRRNYYLPPKKEGTKEWGHYRNEYHRYGNKQSYNYWGLSKYGETHGSSGIGGGYLPPSKDGGVLSIVPKPGGLGGGSYLPVLDNALLPAEPRRPPTYNFIRDECSLRSATGFRLHKGIVKKFYAVPNIYECELLCFKERDFPCTSYAYRYTVTLSAPTDNCYLSNRNYKELDFYTDLEPDRDFDIYTMNNRNRCEEPIVQGRDNSDCFWRVRSGQRLDHKVVRDSLTAKSIVDCQIECLRSSRFTCRAFSYRYGSPVIGGSIDNCQLTDWPFYELDQRIHFIPEPGFEVYERGSYGHGCEPDHFGIRGQHRKDEHRLSEADQLCYIGFGSPARLLPQATRKSLYTPSELLCKEECSKARRTTLFQCMSFSFRTGGDKTLPNCYLSDIYQRDLLVNMDYVYDHDFWLFAWDNYNPECVALANEPKDNHIGGGSIDRQDSLHGLDTWKLYSVSGWPCRRGALCQENRETGFWFCELEGGEKGAWDYCCRPEHQCGSSHGYPYQWCYVGPSKTQWRKCSDRYFPYIHNVIDRLDHVKPYLPGSQKPWVPSSPPVRPGGRPDRPPAPPREPPPRPSLNQYEMIFDEEFLDPPKPGGFGQPRHWPVSYLHKEMPPNTTDSRLMRMEEENPKFAAIQNLINVIKSNDLNNVQYHISNESNKADDILFVKIPLPTNFTREAVSSNSSATLLRASPEKESSIGKRSGKFVQGLPRWSEVEKSTESTEGFDRGSKPSPVYRRGFVTRTNVTGRGSYR
nr:uncharacterized protein LOC111511130 isoform X1 [Leptinotarsa decemlineata]